MIYAIMELKLSHYSEIEIHGVVLDWREGEPEDCACWIEENETPEEYGVYLRIAEGDCKGQLECIADFDNAKDARAYASNFSQLTGWPITDKLRLAQ